jgi:uncharacterized lipoprotein YddW (UPF0748 family)
MPAVPQPVPVTWQVGKNTPCPVRLSLVLFSITFLFQADYASAAYEPSSTTPPVVSREFRGAWVASVGNITWPSPGNFDPAQQKAELIGLLERASKLKLNAIILQVRPACDALYASRIEPWSEYLTGQMGKAPDPYYDPLELAVREAHARGLELHAWFNPFRAKLLSAKSPISSNHISKRRPDLVKRYGGSLWMDPGEKDVQDYSASVVMDVVRRYDVDGIHFDDYFYPYVEKDGSGRPMDFPDWSSWHRYGEGSKLNRGDWRRENVNSFVQRIYREIKAAKPWVKFGISPFGIWRPGNPPEIRGKDAYAEVFADSRKWLANGWVDYFTPQLYWAVDSPNQSFPALLTWWTLQNRRSRHLWPGLNTANSTRTWPASEIDRQISLTRNQQGVSGHVHWDMKKGILQNPEVERLLAERVYTRPALVPASTWLSQQTPEKPKVTIKLNGDVTVNWQCGSKTKPFLWVVQTRSGDDWKTEIFPSHCTSRSWSRKPQIISVLAVDRVGLASTPEVFELKE